MSAFSKTKTTSKSKITALLSLLLLLNFATAWGQTQTEISPDEYHLQCGNTYNYKATTEGTYIFTNNTGASITISGITLNTLRYGRSSGYT